MIWTLAFWKGAGERAIKTFFQVLATLITVDATGIGTSVGLTDIEWPAILSIAALSTVASLCVSVANADFTAGVQPVEVVTVEPAGFRYTS